MEEKIMSSSSELPRDPKKGSIIIEAEAFIVLLEHVISHENTPVLEPFCVGGVLNGEFNGEDVIISETIPFFHGTQEQMEYFENYQNALKFVKGRKTTTMGWYSSRLNENSRFTLSNIQTHHVFQNAENPKSFTLIINPIPSDNLPVTMKAYRFPTIENTTDIQQIQSIPVIVKVPETTQIYQKVQMIIENSQNTKPIHQIEIAQSLNTLKSPVQHLVSSSSSTINLLKMLLEIVRLYYQGLNSNSGKLLASLNAVVKNIQNGFSSVMTDMQRIMQEEGQHILESIDQNFEKVNSEGDYLSTSIEQFIEKVSTDFGQILRNVLEPKLKEFKENLVEIVEESAEIGQKIDMFTDSVKDQQATLESFKQSLEGDTSSIEESIHKLKAKLDNQFNGTKKSTEKSIDQLKQDLKKIDETLNKIEKMMID
jgi:hypothetical protein